MGKYSTFSRRDSSKKNKTIHPIWRGIGFLFMFLIPILSYFGALVLIDENNKRGWVPIPADLIIKAFDPLILVKAIIIIVLMIILFAIFMLVTFLFNSLFGPSRYGPLDVPPAAYRHRKRSK